MGKADSALKERRVVTLQGNQGPVQARKAPIGHRQIDVSPIGGKYKIFLCTSAIFFLIPKSWRRLAI
jgi:hypothetical protein